MFISGLQFLDSDDSSLWSSSTETTNVDERTSLTDFQHSSSSSSNSKPGESLYIFKHLVIIYKALEVRCFG
jgi:hypothetical protein